MRWRDDVEGALGRIGVAKWTRTAQDRGEWRRIIEGAVAHTGL